MPRSTTVIIQCICIIVAMLAPLLPVSKEWHQFVATIPAVVSAVSAILAHSYNPDGTTAAVGYDRTDNTSKSANTDRTL